jgi:uncharacterized protein YegP (UPF0339 family)
MEADDVQALLEQMKAEHGEIIAHPMMYVSALHNRQGCFPVSQDDEFFSVNGIRFLQLPEPPTAEDQAAQPSVKYVVKLDDSGTYRHALVRND